MAMVIRGGLAAGRALGYARKVGGLLNTPLGRKAAKAAISAASQGFKYAQAKKKGSAARKLPANPMYVGTKSKTTNPANVGQSGRGLTMYGKRGKTLNARRRKGKPSSTIQQCMMKGFYHTTEIIGTVNDPNCVYIVAQSYPQVALIEIAVASLLRKLFKKGAGWNCVNYEERIPGYPGYVNDADGWRIEMYSQNRDLNTVTTYAYNTVTTETIKTLVGDIGAGITANMAVIMNPILGYSAGYSYGANITNILEPFKFRLFARDGNVTNFYHAVADLNLHNETIHFCSSVRTRLQNRTVSDSGLSITNDITVNPVSGKVYDFSNAHPATRVDGTWLMEQSTPHYGLNLQRAAQFSIGAQKTVPEKKIFTNCTGVRPISMEPGQQATTYFTHSGKNLFLKLLQKIHVGAGDTTQIRMGVGASQMIALEEDLNYSASQKVLIVSETVRKIGCWSKTGKDGPAQSGYTQLTLSNTTA